LKRLKELNTQTGASGGVTTLPFDLSNIPSYFNGVYKPTDNNDLVKYVTDIWTNRYSPVNY
jgi:hypothetical protein